MSYSSLSFLVFTVVVCIFYFLLPQRCRWTVLLAASCIFYAVNSKLLSVFILLSIAVLYVFARLIEKQNALFKQKKGTLEKDERKALKAHLAKRKKGLVAAAVAVNVGILLVLKYSGFFADTVSAAASVFGADSPIKHISFTLPLGISYYTLTGISYVTDVYRGTVPAEKNPFKLALFLSFFPQIVEGPLSRYGTLSQTLFTGASFDYDRFVSGSVRILWGFVKKLVIADRAALPVNAIFELGAQASGIQVLFAAALYTFQIYAEFSGCMDIVCGISEILGIDLPENFRQPFFSKSIDEFWRRWHITLGAWLRDYIFYPVSLSASSKKLSGFCREKLGGYYGALVPAAYALFFVWFANGFWHGASWKYICYGLYYYIFMMLGKLLKPLADKLPVNRASVGYGIFAVLRTCVIVLFGMLLFRAPSLQTAAAMTGKIFTQFLPGGGLLHYENFEPSDFAVLVVGFLAMLTVGIFNEKGICIRKKLSQKHFIFTWVIALALIFILLIFGIYGGNTVSTFIYGQF